MTAPLTGLQPGTTYYDEVVATSAGGTTDGTILSFTGSSVLKCEAWDFSLFCRSQSFC